MIIITQVMMSTRGGGAVQCDLDFHNIRINTRGTTTTKTMSRRNNDDFDCVGRFIHVYANSYRSYSGGL